MSSRNGVSQGEGCRSCGLDAGGGQVVEAPWRPWEQPHFLNFIFLLYWNMVDLQFCVSFRCTGNWFSYTHIHSFSVPFPSPTLVLAYFSPFPIFVSPLLSPSLSFSQQNPLQFRATQLIFSHRAYSPLATISSVCYNTAIPTPLNHWIFYLV